jgi:hypothetical protein
MQDLCVDENNNAKSDAYSPYVVVLVGLVEALIGLLLVAVLKRI